MTSLIRVWAEVQAAEFQLMESSEEVVCRFVWVSVHSAFKWNRLPWEREHPLLASSGPEERVPQVFKASKSFTVFTIYPGHLVPTEVPGAGLALQNNLWYNILKNNLRKGGNRSKKSWVNLYKSLLAKETTRRHLCLGKALPGQDRLLNTMKHCWWGQGKSLHQSDS